MQNKVRTLAQERLDLPDLKNLTDFIEEEFKVINTTTYYFVKKSVRRILRLTKKYIRYTGNKETEVALLLFFCLQLKNMSPTYLKSVPLVNLMGRLTVSIKKTLSTIHEDMQLDYQNDLDNLHE